MQRYRICGRHLSPAVGVRPRCPEELPTGAHFSSSRAPSNTTDITFYRQTWIGLRPRHLAHSSQFGWLSRKLPSALGLWTDGMLVDPTEPADKRNAAARGVWQEITTSRALGKWDGLGFGTVVGLSEPDAAGRALDDVCCAASFVLDCLIVDSAKEGASRAHLDAVKRLRQAVVTVAPPLSSEAELRNYLISLAGVADGVILGCPTENPQNAFEYLGKLSGEAR